MTPAICPPVAQEPVERHEGRARYPHNGPGGFAAPAALASDRPAGRFLNFDPIGVLMMLTVARLLRSNFDADRRPRENAAMSRKPAFSPSARETVELLSKRIVLIDGDQLTMLMIRHNVGCRVEDTLHIKKIDEDFFE
jgi:hypothetical protein